MEEQLSMLEETRAEKILKQMKQAVAKGIVPEATVMIDGKFIYSIMNIYAGRDGVELRLINESGGSIVSWLALSDRLTVINS